MTKKVIIIDDSQTQLNIINDIFKTKSWETLCIKNPEDAFYSIFQFAPDLIISDALMPGIGGFQLLKQIKENDKISEIPIIIYSVLSQASAKYYLKHNSKVNFLTKSDNKIELLNLAEEVIKTNPVNQNYKDEIIKSADLYKPKEIQTKEENIIIPQAPKETLKEKININLNSIKENLITNKIKTKKEEEPKIEHPSAKYLNNLDRELRKQFDPINKKTNMFIGIISINNYIDIDILSEEEEMDYLNSKISKTIRNYLEKEEQIYRIKEDEYTIIIFAKDDKQALNRFGIIVNILNDTIINNHQLDVAVGISNCYFDNNYNIHEAQKQARLALEKTNMEKRTVINYAE